MSSDSRFAGLEFSEPWNEAKGRPDFFVKQAIGPWVVTYVLEFAGDRPAFVSRVAVMPVGGRVPEGGITPEVLQALRPALAVEFASATVLHPQRVAEQEAWHAIASSPDFQRWEAAQLVTTRPGNPRVADKVLIRALDAYRAACAEGTATPLDTAAKRLKIGRDLLRSYLYRARKWGILQPARRRGAREINFTPEGKALLARYRKQVAEGPPDGAAARSVRTRPKASHSSRL